MTTSTLTLTDFLLARIAEDEAQAINWSRFEIRDGIPGSYAIPARVLAECAAKRAIVEACRVDYEDSLTSGDDTTGLAEEVLLALAAIYADHESFRAEWTL